MSPPKPRRRARLDCVPLEPRETPAAAWQTETFDQIPNGALPNGWSQLTGPQTGATGAAAAKGLSGTSGLTSTATQSDQSTRAWQTAAVPADTAVSVAVMTESLQPIELVARGQNLGGAAPTYYAVSITRGIEVTLTRVVNGIRTDLATVKTPAYLSGRWVQITLTPVDNSLKVQVQRLDTNQFLAANGTWQTAETTAITVADSAISGAGQVGLARPARYVGTVAIDNFSVRLPATASNPPPVAAAAAAEFNDSQSFDQTAVGAVPAGWARWTAGGATAAVSTAAKLSAPNGLVSTSAASGGAARTWLNAELAPDQTVSASVLLNSLIPATIFARGTNLDTAAPTYYGAVITRGVEVEIVKVVNGQTTRLAALKSQSYLSGPWARVTIEAVGNQLRVTVQRQDTGQYLNSAGQWQATATHALAVTDGSITGPGEAGLARPARYAGDVVFDNFSVSAVGGDITPPTVAITSPLPEAGALAGIVRVQATASDASGIARVEFYVNTLLRATRTTAPYAWDFDTHSLADGTHTLTVIAYDTAGNSARSDRSIVIRNAAPGDGRPVIPQHYSHIRIAQLAYSGTPMTEFELNLLQNSVDLVIPNPSLLAVTEAAAPDTPKLIYTNLSNLYLGLLTDWLAYADAHGIDREAAFYHAAAPYTFSGTSPSSLPVNWFWSVWRQQTAGGGFDDLTVAARNTAPGDVAFASTAGGSLFLAYPDRFRELNVILATGRANGWGAVVEYVSAVDANGNPTAWKSLSLVSDSTAGLTRSGQITFDPPADWVAASVNGSARLFYLRIRTTHSGTAPVVSQLLGRDFVNANGGNGGTVPVFDAAADRDGDGYLNDAEYAARAAGKDARFYSESRLPYQDYGQMRWALNPSSAAVKAWAVDYQLRYLAAHPLADGLFVDNSMGKSPVYQARTVEGVTNYAPQLGALLSAVNQAIAPRWVLANTAGGGTPSDAVLAQVPASMEEFAIRAMAHNHSQFRDLAQLVARRQNLADPTPYLIIDSLPQGGDPTDPRTQLATLAYYYLLGNPDTTFLMMFGGFEPSSSWTRHWTDAIRVDVGRPQGAWFEFASGADPANTSLNYRVYGRTYENALVLYKPRSYTMGVGTGTTADNTVTWHDLGGTYRTVNADGTLGPPVTRVQLRNGEGAILIKA